MSVVKRQNVCFGTKYTDNAGQKKTRWVTVGKAFHSDRDGISIKFDTIPAGGWDGWVQLFDEQGDTGAELREALRIRHPRMRGLLGLLQ